MKKLGANRAYREECGQFLCDGAKLLAEAVKSGIEVVAVMTSANALVALPPDTRVCSAPRELIDSLSPLKNAQDTLFTCKTPPSGGVVDTEGTLILLDGIQDPGNLGTIIRTADAFRIKSAILTGMCADRWNPKTIRSSMGAVFRQKVYQMGIRELEGLRDGGARFIGAVCGRGDRRGVQRLQWGARASEAAETGCGAFGNRLEGAIIAIGNEGQGLSEDVLSLCGEKVAIPIAPDCESLNAAVAAAILMWEAGRS
jgi:TrmH family RNA methyltransferase